MEKKSGAREGAVEEMRSGAGSAAAGVLMGGMCQQWAMLSSSPSPFRAVLCCNVHRKCFKYIHMPESSNKEEKRGRNGVYGGEISFRVQENGWKKPKRKLPMHCPRGCVCVRISFTLTECASVRWQGQQTPMHSGEDVARQSWKKWQRKEVTDWGYSRQSKGELADY